MDIKLEKKPWYIRYRYYLAGGIIFLAFIIYVIILCLYTHKSISLHVSPGFAKHFS